MNNHNSGAHKFKNCTSGDQCIHHDGPRLPATEKYFYITSSGHMRGKCKECAKEQRRRDHEKNRERDNKRSREYAKKNRHRYELYKNNYYIRKAEAVKESYSIHDIDIIYKRQQGRCWWCQQFVGLKFEIDHRIPLSRGGKDDVSNIVVACGTCNRSKGDKLPHEWCGRLL